VGLFGSPQLHPTSADAVATTPIPDAGDVELAPGERTLLADTFRYSSKAFFLRTRVVVTDRRIAISRPNTLLGMLPVGTRRSTFPVENVAGVSAATRLSIGWLLVAAFAFLVGLNAISTSAQTGGGIVWLAIGVLVLMLAVPQQAIEILNSGGGAIRFRVSAVERSKTIEFASEVSKALARTARVDQRPVLPARADPDAAAALRRLNELRDAGLVTADEYTAKRSEILARL
jgi:Short C-terminal domain